MKKQKWLLTVGLILFYSGGMALSYESVFSKTSVGAIEIKQIQPARIMETQMNQDYFSISNQLFRRLFKYLKQNKVSMTVPVESEMEPGIMRFYLGQNDAKRDLTSQEEVIIKSVPGRTVASLGSRGSYTQKNIQQSIEKLETWLASQSEWAPIGSAYAVFWNGPFMPGFLKRYEVHFPIKKND